MRQRFVFTAIVTLTAFVLYLESQNGLAQQPGGQGGPGGGFGGFGGGKGGFGGFGGGKGGFNLDPAKLFDLIAKDRGYIVIEEMRRGKEQAEAFAKAEGITDGKLTREQFVKYSEQQQKLREAGGAPGAPGAPAAKGDGKGGKGFGKGFGKGGFDPEALFKRYDTNGDGNLNEEEIAEVKGPFKNEWKKWDKDNNGLISLDEFKAYMEAQQQQWAEKMGGDKKDGEKDKITIIEIDDVVDNTVVVWRPGFMPKQLPTWFTQYDTNRDGQVSLAEWIAGKQDRSAETLAEFAKIDRNDDGLLTAEEVLRSQGLDIAALQGVSESELGEAMDKTTQGFGGKGFGGKGFGGKGFGGKGFGGKGFGGKGFGGGGMPGFGGGMPGFGGGQPGFGGGRQGFGGGRNGKKNRGGGAGASDQ